MADHPPLTAVAAALPDMLDWNHERIPEKDVALAVLRALATDPVRDWAATVPCRRWGDAGLPCDYRAGTPTNDPELGTAVHPECLLAALAGEVAGVRHDSSGSRGETMTGDNVPADDRPLLSGRMVCQDCGATLPITTDNAQEQFEEHARDAHTPSVHFDWDRHDDKRPPPEHPPVRAVAVALGNIAAPSWLVRSGWRTSEVAEVVLRALVADPVREWLDEQFPSFSREEIDWILDALAPPEQP